MRLDCLLIDKDIDRRGIMYCSSNFSIQCTPLKFNKSDLIDCLELISTLFSSSCPLSLHVVHIHPSVVSLIQPELTG